LIRLSPEQKYKNFIKLKINNDSQYEILAEDFYTMKINWNEFNNSLICSTHFKIGNFIWYIFIMLLNGFKELILNNIIFFFFLLIY